MLGSVVMLAVSSLSAQRKVEDSRAAIDPFTIHQKQNLGNFGLGFLTHRWPVAAQKRFDEFRDNMRKVGKDII